MSLQTKTISVTDYKSRMDSENESYLIDVRMPSEFEQVHISNALLYPLEELSPEDVINQLGCNRDETIYVICHSGGRAKKACQKFIDAGIENIVQIDGGIQAWESAGLPTVKSSRRIISLQRQVQLAAGSLIVLGFMLSILVHPWLIGISVFVGCGLIFAGLTDTCGMAVFLAKMPWNKPKGCIKNCACSVT